MKPRVPIHCIIPPHMLREISARGDADLRAAALATLALSEQMRGRRMLMGPLHAAPSGGRKRRTIFDAGSGTDLPGRRLRGEGDEPTGDAAADEAWDGAGATWDLFFEEFQRDSVDGRGLRLDATVHFGREYDNAFWNGSQMVYGDGDGRLFDRFTRSVDVIGHELTHGVTQYEAKLDYEGQSGALNEHFSDVFGSLVKQRQAGQAAQDADWLVGAGLLLPGVRGKALRSMKEPGTAYDDPLLGADPQPGHMKNYQDVAWDNGGVHINSGIPNRAFCLAAIGIGGPAWLAAGRIWYVALCERLPHRSTFRAAATATLSVAGEIYGSGSREQNAVRHGWGEVGVSPAN